MFVPPAALALGYGGLLPFVAGAGRDLGADEAGSFYVSMALAAYAATIVSFLGGIHWGLAFRHDAPPTLLLLWGVLPSLAAWSALLLHPALGLMALGAMLLACLVVDRHIYRREGVAHWLPLRLWAQRGGCAGLLRRCRGQLSAASGGAGVCPGPQ